MVLVIYYANYLFCPNSRHVLHTTTHRESRRCDNIMLISNVFQASILFFYVISCWKQLDFIIYVDEVRNVKILFLIWSSASPAKQIKNFATSEHDIVYFDFINVQNCETKIPLIWIFLTVLEFTNEFRKIEYFCERFAITNLLPKTTVVRSYGHLVT